MSDKTISRPGTTLKKTTKKMGRPTVLTPENIKVLKSAFMVGATDEQACAFAEVSTSALYRYIDKHPDFGEKKTYWKQNPVLVAKNTVVKDLKDIDTAKWYLEKHPKSEFNIKSPKGFRIQTKDMKVEFIDYEG